MAVEVIEAGIHPDERKFEHVCGVCTAKLTYTRQDIKTMGGWSPGPTRRYICCAFCKETTTL